MLVTTASGLASFYEETGDDDRGEMATAPPPCGKAVPDYRDNHSLVLDCQTLLGLKDALRGTGTLNWSVDVAIGDWDGVTTGGTPSRVTKVEVEDEDLTGSIPVELAELSGLEELRLSGNRLSGCIPVGLKDVDANDLDQLGLPDCTG